MVSLSFDDLTPDQAQKMLDLYNELKKPYPYVGVPIPANEVDAYLESAREESWKPQCRPYILKSEVDDDHASTEAENKDDLSNKNICEKQIKTF